MNPTTTYYTELGTSDTRLTRTRLRVNAECNIIVIIIINVSVPRKRMPYTHTLQHIFRLSSILRDGTRFVFSRAVLLCFVFDGKTFVCRKKKYAM